MTESGRLITYMIRPDFIKICGSSSPYKVLLSLTLTIAGICAHDDIKISSELGEIIWLTFLFLMAREWGDCEIF